MRCWPGYSGVLGVFTRVLQTSYGSQEAVRLRVIRSRGGIVAEFSLACARGARRSMMRGGRIESVRVLIDLSSQSRGQHLFLLLTCLCYLTPGRPRPWEAGHIIGGLR